MSAPMKYPLRIDAIVSDTDRPEANQIAKEVAPYGAIDANTYSCELSGPGGTFWACSTGADDALAAAMQANMPRVPSVQFFLSLASSGALVSTNASGALPMVGQVFSFEDALQVLGMERAE